MVFPDPDDNPFYFLSDRAKAVLEKLSAEHGNAPHLFRAIIRALAMGAHARNPFVYERHDPAADPHRPLNVYWQNLHITFRNPPDDPRFEVLDIEVTPDSHPPGTFFP